MLECTRDNQYATTSGLINANAGERREQVLGLLRKIIEKCQEEPLFLEQQPQQTNLLVSIAQLNLLPSSNSISNDRKAYLTNMMNIVQDLLTDTSLNNTNSSVDICKIESFDVSYRYEVFSGSSSPENPASSPVVPPSNVTTKDDFSLDDLANEYLQNEPTPPSSNDKANSPSESGETDLSSNDLSRNDSSSSPSTPLTNISSTLLSPVPLTDSQFDKTSLESILFSNHLSSHTAAADADEIWKEISSPFGELFCQKHVQIDAIPSKRISTCLLDRSLYERLTRLIILLPKQCVQNSAQQITIRSNDSYNRSTRTPNNHRRPPNRPSFQQNYQQSNPTPRYSNPQNPRPYGNQYYSNQQGNSSGNFVDYRSQQSNRYPPDQYYQPRGPPRNNFYNNTYQEQQQQQQQPRRRPPASNDQQQQRGTSRRGFGG